MPRTLSRGKCSFCQTEYSKSGMTKHLETCKARVASIESEAANPPKSRQMKSKIFHILVEGYYQPAYWMHLEVPGHATLADVDDFLRRIWLECCGHLSAFRMGGVSYTSEEEMISHSSWGFSPRYQSMNVRLDKVLSPGMKFSHEYDFGTTTELSLKVIAEREGVVKGKAISIMVRNEPFKTACQVCGAPAVGMCERCGDEGGWLCATCAELHDCGEERLIPIVNSPRAGVCGYPGIY